MTVKEKLKKLGVSAVAWLGALGTGLQNYMGVASLIQSLMSASLATGRAGLGLIHSFAVLLGGFCSTLMNYCMNIKLLQDFYVRLTQSKKPNLTGWAKFRYYFGISVFVGTGILFGLTAIAFGPTGALALVSIFAGIFVSVIMIIQEVETWLKSFDGEQSAPKSLKQSFCDWKTNLTGGKLLGLAITIGNVFALSLLFTIALGSFFVSLGVPALPALIAGAAVAFTGGAFTEGYFYYGFLSDFCDKFKAKWNTIWEQPYPALGIASAAGNAVVNAALAYTGVFMLTSLLAAASIAAPPLGAIIAVAAVTAVFAGSASFILGLDFWIDNAAKLKNFFSRNKKPISSEMVKPTVEEGAKNTADIKNKFSLGGESATVSSAPVTPIQDQDSSFTDKKSQVCSLLFKRQSSTAESNALIPQVTKAAGFEMH